MVGGKPCPGAEISGHCDATLAEGWKIVPAADHWIEVNADAAGHFKLDRLKPGRWDVQQGIPFHPGDRPYPSHDVRVNAAAGATATVQIGGEGRSIVGRVELPALDPPAVADLAFVQNDWATKAEPPATYGEVQAMSQPEREALAKTEAFQEYERQSWAGYERRCFRAFTVRPVRRRDAQRQGRAGRVRHKRPLRRRRFEHGRLARRPARLRDSEKGLTWTNGFIGKYGTRLTSTTISASAPSPTSA